MLAHDFPAWQTVYHYFRLWRKHGIWQDIHDEIYTQTRRAEGREAEASAAAIGSQSVKAVALRGESMAWTFSNKYAALSATYLSIRSAW